MIVLAGLIFGEDYLCKDVLFKRSWSVEEFMRAQHLELAIKDEQKVKSLEGNQYNLNNCLKPPKSD